MLAVVYSNYATFSFDLYELISRKNWNQLKELVVSMQIFIKSTRNEKVHYWSSLCRLLKVESELE